VTTEPQRGDTTLHHWFETPVSPLRGLGIVMRRVPRAYARGYRSVAPVGLRTTRRYCHAPDSASSLELSAFALPEPPVIAKLELWCSTPQLMDRSDVSGHSCGKGRQACPYLQGSVRLRQARTCRHHITHRGVSSHQRGFCAYRVRRADRTTCPGSATPTEYCFHPSALAESKWACSLDS